jgi:hypothetical protein
MAEEKGVFLPASGPRKGRPAATAARLVVKGVAALLDAVGAKEAVREHLLPRLVAAATEGDGRGRAIYGAAAEIARQALESRLDEIARTRGPVLVGPWLSEVGFELLYWIPFLRWAVEERGLDPKRLVALSRGDVHAWYRGLCGDSIEIFDLLDLGEWRALSRDRWTVMGQKQKFRHTLDDELIERANRRLGADAAIFHPSLMFNLFRGYFGGRSPADLLARHSRIAPLPEPGPLPRDLRLPDEYVAVRFYGRPSFPDVAENRDFAAAVVQEIASRTDVVVIATGIEVDDHADFDLPTGPRIHLPLAGRVALRENLAVQDAIVAGARAFVGTYGGLSYLAPLHGVPAVAFHSAAEHFLPVHLATAHATFRDLGASFAVLGTRDLDRAGLGPVLSPLATARTALAAGAAAC